MRCVIPRALGFVLCGVGYGKEGANNTNHPTGKAADGLSGKGARAPGGVKAKVSGAAFADSVFACRTRGTRTRAIAPGGPVARPRSPTDLTRRREILKRETDGADESVGLPARGHVPVACSRPSGGNCSDTHPPRHTTAMGHHRCSPQPAPAQPRAHVC